MDKKKLPIIILIIVIIAFAVYIFSADTLFAKEEDKYTVEHLTVITTAYDPFNTLAMMGVYNVKKEDLADVKFVLIDDNDNSKEYLSESSARHPDLICSVGFTLQENLYQTALENPDNSYLTIDMTLPEEDIPDNLVNIVFRSNEASYVAGYAAGMTTKTNIIGFVGGMDSSIIQGFYYGFASGIARAEKEKGAKITILQKYVGSYSQPDKAGDLALEMYNSGADIIYSVAGASGNGVINAAVQKNKYVIGVDSDQNYMAPENVIFSVIKKIDVAIHDTILGYINNGKHKGGIISVGYKEGGVDVVSYLDVVNSGVVEKAKSIEQEIIDGRLTVPNTEEEYKLYISQH